MRGLLVGLLVGFALLKFSSAVKCKSQNKYCKDGTCKDLECTHGGCQTNGSCLCHQCFTGVTCNNYTDEYHPYFLKKEETIYIEETHEGLVYEARARDEDNFKTCLPESTLPCPCGEVAYEIVIDGLGEGFFLIDHSLGDLSLSKNAKLKAGDKFKVDIATSNYKEDFPYEQKEMSIDILTLNIIVRESNSIENLMRLSAVENNDQENVKYIYEADVEMMSSQKLLQSQDDIEVDELERTKRSAYATVNGTTNMTLVVTNSVLEPIQPGTTINFRLTVILAQAPSPNGVSLSIEIFVMDAVTGITTFGLCDVVVVSIGSAISPITVAQANQNIDLEFNSKLGNVYDRATIDFGTVVNSASTFGGPDYTDSTVIITFKATMIPNSNFLNSTAIVTAGADYFDEYYVWVSQASFNYSNNLQTYPSSVTVMGPDAINQYSGGTYDILAYVSNAYDVIEVEVFSPQDISDLFSITSLNIVSKGTNFGCILGQDNYTFFRSVSGLTNHKYSVKFPIIVSNLDYSNNLASEASDPGNLIKISFSVFMYGATPGSVVTIGAGLSIGFSTIWTALANVTVNPGTIPPSVTGSVTSMTATSVDSSTGVNSPQVNMSMTATWDLRLVLPPASNAQITCTATPGANSQICGVNYGISGTYVAVFPNLTNIVVYNSDGSASWNFVTNTSVIGASQTRDTTQDYLSIEVTVVYLAASPSPATVTCGANSVTLTAVAGPAGILDVSGVTKILGNNNIIYASSQAGLMATLTFPPGGVGYSDMTLETSGDFFTTTFGTQVCRVDVVKIGRGIGCAAKGAARMAQLINITRGSNTSLYNDAAVVDFGPICGSKRDASYSRPDDDELVIRVIYDIPKGQTVPAGIYNISLGVLFDVNVIWTGWGSYSLSSAVPAIVTTLLPMFKVIQPTLLTQPQFVPIVIKAYIKTHPGSIGNYMIVANSSVPGIIDLCRIVIVNVGYDYACIDTNPYGKEIDPAQKVTIIHPPGAWGASAALKLGILRNFGNDTIEPSTIADQDTIEIAVIARGTLPGAGTITVTYTDGTQTLPVLTNITISGAASVTTNSITMNVTGMDNTMTFYDGVMKTMVATLNVPSQLEAYQRPVQLQIVNNSPLLGSICFAAVIWAGMNVPCAVPALFTSAPVVSATQEILQIDFGYLCYLPLTNNDTENLVVIRFGLMPAKGQTSLSVDVVLVEANVPATPVTVTVTSGGAYTPGNISVDDITLFITDNATVTNVKPGQMIWLPLSITIPRGLTIPAELGIMTQSSYGHAQATVQGFSWGVGAGKNIQCLQTIDMYNVTYMQNASIDNITMIHSSQKDTLLADLKYLTNNELSYAQGNYAPGDDTVQIQALILIADHENLPLNSLIPVSFALKVGTAIIVASKNFTLIAATAPAMVLNMSLSFTNSTPPFDPTVPLQQYEKLYLTVLLQHVLNQSTQEAYNAIVRIMLPSYIGYANATTAAIAIPDNYTSNITASLTAREYLDFNITCLFFTDILELNFSVTVDPNNTMPKGLGTLDSTALLRFACSPSKSIATLVYGGTSTPYVNYLTLGTECFDDLNTTTFLPCQFLASTAIDITVTPEFSVTATGWSPATRDTTIFENFLIIDFLRLARITEVVFTSVSGKRSVGTYKLQYSYDGSTFMDVTTCSAPIISSTSVIPALCRFQSRYVRMVILSADSADDSIAIGVSAKWYGCYVDAVPTAAIPCGLTGTTILTTTVGAWRHMAYDTVNLILYFCDYNPRKIRMVCYSAKDSAPTTWTALPSYIGSLAGFYNGMMYAYDTKKVAMVSSIDGANWALVDSLVEATVATSATPPSAITGADSTHFTNVILGPWTADFTGVMNLGTYAVKWGKCCV